MKRKEKPSGVGRCLRFGMLLASISVFVLVAAATASAQNTHILIEGSGSGEVFGEEPNAGEPPIECSYVSPGPTTGTCDANAVQSEEGAPFLVKINHKAAPGSKFGGWIVEEGSAFFCPEENPGAGSCVAGPGPELVVKAIFEKEPNVHIKFEGSGSGTITGVPGPLEGTPPVNCHWNGSEIDIGIPEAGKCDVLAGSAFGTEGINVKHAADLGSAFGGWKVEGGIKTSCEVLAPECAVAFFGAPETTITATFTPPPVPLNLTTSGSGSGSFECDTGSGPEPCQAEYEEGTEVTVIPVADTGSEFVEFSGDCTGASCELTMDEEKNVNAQFDLEQVPLTIEQEGEGTVLCNGEACAPTYAFGTEITVTATAAAEQQIVSIAGTGSAAGECEKESTTEGSCAFPLKEPSTVTVKFEPASTVATAEGDPVFGDVPQTTTLESECEEVYLGEFLPNKPDTHYSKTCPLIVTATGEVNTLTASDESGVDTGHLTQKPGSPFSLVEPLNTRAEDLDGLGGEGSGLEPLTTPVTLLTYNTPVNGDNVLLEFDQLIKAQEPLHTGIYSKTILLTLKQTTP